MFPRGFPIRPTAEPSVYFCPLSAVSVPNRPPRLRSKSTPNAKHVARDGSALPYAHLDEEQRRSVTQARKAVGRWSDGSGHDRHRVLGKRKR
jgi:hypothetical protein